MKNILLIQSSPRGLESYSQKPYLRAILGFIGLTDVDVVRVEGVD